MNAYIGRVVHVYIGRGAAHKLQYIVSTWGIHPCTSLKRYLEYSAILTVGNNPTNHIWWPAAHVHEVVGVSLGTSELGSDQYLFPKLKA